MNCIKQVLKSLRLRFESFFKHIPGFRTGEKINMIIAGIYYILCLLFLIVGLILSRWKAIPNTISALFLPYFIFSFVDYMNNKIEK